MTFPNYTTPGGPPSQQPALSRMAMTAMILGIIAIPTGCIGIGVLLGIVAIILGIMSLGAINKNPAAFSGKGFALTGIITGIAGIVIGPVLILAVIWPVMGRSRELANRTSCAANLNGCMKCMLVYANENADCLPCPPAGTSSPTYAEVNYDPHTAAGNNNSLAVLAILVSEGATSPKAFLCRSDPNSSKTPGTTGMNGLVNMAANQNSYSIAVPWSRPGTNSTTGGWWRSTIDSDLPLMGDMVLSGPQVSGRSGDNSINHNGEGQNVGFADAHAEFKREANSVNGRDLHATSPNPIPNAPPYQVWLTPHKSTSGVITTP